MIHINNPTIIGPSAAGVAIAKNNLPNKVAITAKSVLVTLGLLLASAVTVGAALALTGIVTLGLPLYLMVGAAVVGAVAFIALSYYAYKLIRDHYAGKSSNLLIAQYDTELIDESIKELDQKKPTELRGWDQKLQRIESAIHKLSALQKHILDPVEKKRIQDYLEKLERFKMLVNMVMALPQLESSEKQQKEGPIYANVAIKVSNHVQLAIKQIKEDYQNSASINSPRPEFQTPEKIQQYVKNLFTPISENFREVNRRIQEIERQLQIKQRSKCQFNDCRSKPFITKANELLVQLRAVAAQLNEGDDVAIPDSWETFVSNLKQIVEFTNLQGKKDALNDLITRLEASQKEKAPNAADSNKFKRVKGVLESYKEKLDKNSNPKLPDYLAYTGQDLVSHLAALIEKQEALEGAIARLEGAIGKREHLHFVTEATEIVNALKTLHLRVVRGENVEIPEHYLYAGNEFLPIIVKQNLFIKALYHIKTNAVEGVTKKVNDYFLDALGKLQKGQNIPLPNFYHSTPKTEFVASIIKSGKIKPNLAPAGYGACLSTNDEAVDPRFGPYTFAIDQSHLVDSEGYFFTRPSNAKGRYVSLTVCLQQNIQINDRTVPFLSTDESRVKELQEQIKALGLNVSVHDRATSDAIRHIFEMVNPKRDFPSINWRWHTGVTMGAQSHALPESVKHLKISTTSISEEKSKLLKRWIASLEPLEKANNKFAKMALKELRDLLQDLSKEIPKYYYYSELNYADHIVTYFKLQMLIERVQSYLNKQNPFLPELAKTVLTDLKQKSELHIRDSLKLPEYYEEDNEYHIEKRLFRVLKSTDKEFANYYDSLFKHYTLEYTPDGKFKLLSLKATNQRTSITEDFFECACAKAWNLRNTHQAIDAAHPEYPRGLLFKPEGGTIKIFYGCGVIGEGTFSSVSKVLSVTEGIFYAMKAPRADRNLTPQQISAELFKETVVMQAIHYKLRSINESSEGFVEVPQIITLQNTGGARLLYALRDGSLHDWLQKPHSLRTRVQACKKLMQYFAKLIKLERQHYDNKPLNILVQGNQFFLSDFGDSVPFVDHKREIIGGKETFLPYTPLYNSQQDITALDEAFSKREADKYKQIAISRMLYTQGLILLNVLSVNGTLSDDALIIKGCSLEMIYLIRSMVKPLETRITAEAAIKQWDGIPLPDEGAAY